MKRRFASALTLRLAKQASLRACKVLAAHGDARDGDGPQHQAGRGLLRPLDLLFDIDPGEAASGTTLGLIGDRHSSKLKATIFSMLKNFRGGMS